MLFFTAITTLALLLNPSAAAPAPEPAAVIQASEPVNATSGISVRATEPVAVVFTSWSSSRQCSGSSAGYTNADGTCYSLPGQSLRVDRITNTCRTFVYGNRDCTGTEMQVYPGNCYDARDFYTLKTFCH
ncbi:hypothetical protein QBC42DRAFT_350022 [Cladorrhinum samala]|uniref:Uncharacterized protein n=1 Tax=Cladorrhinum samala TaxID=585594 RepID=A0AAV9HB30_9PEZI|nr:hypothetical protein QBC42DRAFT_350022 [Cladorrhinum samala]